MNGTGGPPSIGQVYIPVVLFGVPIPTFIWSPKKGFNLRLSKVGGFVSYQSWTYLTDVNVYIITLPKILLFPLSVSIFKCQINPLIGTLILGRSSLLYICLCCVSRPLCLFNEYLIVVIRILRRVFSLHCVNISFPSYVKLSPTKLRILTFGIQLYSIPSPWLNEPYFVNLTSSLRPSILLSRVQSRKDGTGEVLGSVEQQYNEGHPEEGIEGHPQVIEESHVSFRVVSIVVLELGGVGRLLTSIPFEKVNRPFVSFWSEILLLFPSAFFPLFCYYQSSPDTNLSYDHVDQGSWN